MFGKKKIPSKVVFYLTVNQQELLIKLNIFKFHFRRIFSGISSISAFYGAIFKSFRNQQANTKAVINSAAEERQGLSILQTLSTSS